MFSSVFKFTSRKATRQQRIRDCVDALNARRFEEACALLADDVTVSDANAREICGRDEVMKSERGIAQRFPDRKLVIESMLNHRDTVLIRGNFESVDPEVAGPALWQVEFDGIKISRIEVTRGEKHVTLPKFAATVAA